LVLEEYNYSGIPADSAIGVEQVSRGGAETQRMTENESGRW